MNDKKNPVPRARDEPSGFPLLIEKRDDEQRIAFGWANISVRADGEVIKDYQDDVIDPDELERAAYEFVLKYREGGEMHERSGVAEMVESVVLTKQKQAAMGLPEGIVPEGWWIGFKVLDDAVWQRVKDGTYSMFSIGGKAERVPIP
jgi:hypothetical protein